MPRSPLQANRRRALTTWLAFAVFISLMLIETGAQARLSPFGASLTSANPSQVNRKNIASVRNTDTTNGSRVSITSDAPLNDYAAYWSGNRYYVVIPDADLVTRDLLALQNSLRGQGFQEVRIEKKGRDLVLSFSLKPGIRARVEQKFNRLDVLFTAPPGVVFNPNQNRNTTGTGTQYGTQGGGTTATGNQQRNTSGGYQSAGGGTGSTNSSGGTATASSGGSGGRRSGRPRSGGYSGYSGGGGDRGGGTPLNIPLPSEIQPAASPTPTSPTATASPLPGASPAIGDANTNAQTSASPLASGSPSPEQIAQNNPPAPITAPPSTTSTTTPPAPTASNTGFAAAVRENWLPLLIGLLVLAAIALLMVSRSRAGGGEGREPERRLETKKRETIKEKPASRTGAAAMGGAAAGAAAVAALSKDRTKTAARVDEPPVKTEETKDIAPVAPAVGMEQIGGEVKSLLDGKDYDEAVIASSNPETRQIVSTELLAALASRNPERRLRAREAFNKHGFFDEATQKLRTSGTAAERISAARALGLTQDQAATPHLVAALEDDDPEVRRASVNALAELRDPSAIGPLNALLEREKNRKVPHSLIRRAIEASATIDIPDTSAAAPGSATAGATATSADKKDKDDEDREVFEI